jgi:hypothetical protein
MTDRHLWEVDHSYYWAITISRYNHAEDRI